MRDASIPCTQQVYSWSHACYTMSMPTNEPLTPLFEAADQYGHNEVQMDEEVRRPMFHQHSVSTAKNFLHVFKRTVNLVTGRMQLRSNVLLLSFFPYRDRPFLLNSTLMLPCQEQIIRLPARCGLMNNFSWALVKWWRFPVPFKIIMHSVRNEDLEKTTKKKHHLLLALNFTQAAWGRFF
jgi:hypothetical protein